MYDDAPAVIAGVWSVAEDRGAQFEVAQGPLLGRPRKSAHGIMLPRRPSKPFQVSDRELHQVDALQYACARVDIVASMASEEGRRRRPIARGRAIASDHDDAAQLQL